MERCDVLIIGGGPAGSSLAWSLRHSGLAVTVMDKRTFPRDKICAGWVTPEVMAVLEIDVAAYGKERTIQPITGFRAGLLGHPLLETHYDEPASYGIRRYEFDHFLLQRCGANILQGAEFKTMARDGDDWLVNGQIRAKVVVGAGGHFCSVARWSGARVDGREVCVAAQEIEFLMTPEQAAACKVRPEVPELFFTPDLIGYGWAFRKGDYLNIGLGREDNDHIADHVQRFRSFLIESGRVPASMPEKFKGHAYLLYHHAQRPLLQDGVMLIGDSAGLAYPESGEGIRPAVESGLLAGRVILAAQGDYRQERLAPYIQQMSERFGARQPQPGMMERIPMAFKQALAGPLMQSQWFVRKILVERWFLHRHLPVLPSA